VYFVPLRSLVNN